jgi:hypothetical protein
MNGLSDWTPAPFFSPVTMMARDLSDPTHSRWITNAIAFQSYIEVFHTLVSDFPWTANVRFRTQGSHFPYGNNVGPDTI